MFEKIKSLCKKETPNQTFLIQPINGKLITYSYRDTGYEIRKIASKLKSIGLQKGNHIAILSKNCAHWMMSDIAIMMAGHISIPIYTSLTKKTIKSFKKHDFSKYLLKTILIGFILFKIS